MPLQNLTIVNALEKISYIHVQKFVVYKVHAPFKWLKKFTWASFPLVPKIEYTVKPRELDYPSNSTYFPYGWHNVS